MGLHYNMWRYYDPETGRYLRVDPIGLTSGVNLFLYALNNPNRYFDQLGLDTCVPTANGGASCLMPPEYELEYLPWLEEQKEEEDSSESEVPEAPECNSMRIQEKACKAGSKVPWSRSSTCMIAEQTCNENCRNAKGSCYAYLDNSAPFDEQGCREKCVKSLSECQAGKGFEFPQELYKSFGCE